MSEIAPDLTSSIAFHLTWHLHVASSTTHAELTIGGIRFQAEKETDLFLSVFPLNQVA
ncbi:hypothetical protein [Azotobacter beijerinckii]|uniref:hypothetical protein n=1 Tax=Azotobacter beijerinckii TaxID=170623 RepID=UPI00147FE40A|nr:hypothetical protein [Azotobacter beijerinckii]